MMNTQRMLAGTTALLVVVAIGCGGQPEPSADTAPAAPAPAPAAAPAPDADAAAGDQAARPRLVAPIRGEAVITHTPPVTVRKGNNYVTTIRVQNSSTGSIAGFRAEEFWYDRAGQPVAGSETFRPRQPLQPGQVVDITLTSPANPNADRNALQFNHANGTIKTQAVARIAAPEAAAP
jgi:hypothetical protein